MSKGLSKLQLAIVGLLDGTLRRQVYGGSGGALTTSELLEELQSRGLVREDAEKKIVMFTVRRACHSLLNRDIIEGEYIIHCDYHWARVAAWKIKGTPEPPTRRPGNKRKPKG